MLLHWLCDEATTDIVDIALESADAAALDFKTRSQQRARESRDDGTMLTALTRNIEDNQCGSSDSQCGRERSGSYVNKSILAPGSVVKVYWHGDEKWYEGKVMSQRAARSGSRAGWMTRIEYSNGSCEHRLSQVDYEVVHRVAPTAARPQQAVVGFGVPSSCISPNISAETRDELQEMHEMHKQQGRSTQQRWRLPLRRRMRSVLVGDGRDRSNSAKEWSVADWARLRV